MSDSGNAIANEPFATPPDINRSDIAPINDANRKISSSHELQLARSLVYPATIDSQTTPSAPLASRGLRSTNRPEAKGTAVAALKGSKTEDNLKAAFAGESQANRRYLYFAQKADVEGHNDVAAVFRSTAEGETGHAHGHLEYLEESGDPATGLPIGPTDKNLAAAVAGETHEYTDMYPGMARTAREEGFEEIADWFETLAKAERSHAGRFQRALNELAA
jgi:rubrerythrin